MKEHSREICYLNTGKSFHDWKLHLSIHKTHPPQIPQLMNLSGLCPVNTQAQAGNRKELEPGRWKYKSASLCRQEPLKATSPNVKD